MNSKLLISIIVGLIIGGAAAVFFFILKPQMATQTVELAPTDTMTMPTSVPEIEMTKYQNESGFSFQHPEEVTVKENTPGKTEYANLELTSSEASGSITIKVEDTKLKDLAAWKKQNNIGKDALKLDGSLAEIKLGDMQALIIKESLEDEYTSTLVAAGDEVLYTIKLQYEGNNDYWESVFNTLVSTFAFELPESAQTPKSSGSSSSSSPGDSDIILEEETIE